MIFLIVKLLDPIIIVLAIAGGVLSRTWWHVALAAFVVGCIAEAILFATQLTRTFNPIVFLIGVLAAGCWAALAHFLRLKWSAQRRSN
jgi:hypothetical protein